MKMTTLSRACEPNGTVVPIHLTLYFSEWRAKFQERQVQNKLAKARRDASWQTKDSAPNAQSNVTAPPLPPAREGHDCFLESRTLARDYKRKKLEQAPIICFRVGGSFSQNLETTFLLGLGGMHVEHQARYRGAGDERCVEMITWKGSPTCILHLHLMDRLSNGTPSHGYPRAPCAIPTIKMEKRRKINREMVQIAHGT